MINWTKRSPVTICLYMHFSELILKCDSFLQRQLMGWRRSARDITLQHGCWKFLAWDKKRVWVSTSQRYTGILNFSSKTIYMPSVNSLKFYWGSLYLTYRPTSSNFCRRNKALIREHSQPRPGSSDLYFPTQYSQSGFMQCMACLWKQHKSYWRNTAYSTTRIFFTAVTALLFGTIYWRLGSETYAIRRYSDFT